MAGALHAQFGLHGLDLVGAGGGVDQRRLVVRGGKVQRGVGHGFAARQRERVDAQRRAALLQPAGHLPVGRARGAARQHHARAVDGGDRVGIATLRQQAGAAEIPGQAQRDAGAAGDQRQAGAGFAQREQVRIRHRIGDRQPHAVGPQRRDALGRGLRAARDGVIAQQADLALALALQHAHQAGIGHRRQRMVFHARFVEQRIAHEQVAAEDGAAVLGEGGAGDGEIAVERVQQRFGDRADIAGIGRIEGRAVLEHELAAALRAQPLQRGQRLGHGLDGRDGAGLERHHQRIGFANVLHGAHVGQADGLHGAHAIAHQRVGEVGGAGEIVGDAAQ
ncbi:hypothetical protein D3C72_1268080 [compost metagenome]